MPLWGSLDQNNNAPQFIVLTTGTPVVSNAVAGGNANPEYVSAYNNTTPGAFIGGTTVGVFGLDTKRASLARSAHGFGSTPAGWIRTRFGSGPVSTAAVTNNGATFANGETITFSGGSANGQGVITTNSIGGMVSVSVVTGGAGFSNLASVTTTFDREKHLSTLTLTGTATGYSNTDKINVANGTVNATATFVTNTTGGFITANITVGTVGLFPAALTNAQLSVTILNANGTASVGTGATVTGNLVTSTNGSVALTLGGRAGRISQESLVAMASISTENATSLGLYPNT